MSRLRALCLFRNDVTLQDRDVLLDLLILGFCVEKSMVASPAILSLR